MSSRLSKIKSELKKRRLDAILVSSLPNITYLTNYSGFSSVEREAFLLITKNKQYIITDGRYSEAVHAQIKNFELIERATAFPFEKILKQLSQKHKIKRLGIEENNLTISEYKLLSKHYNNTYHYSVASLRVIKDPDEIKAIEKACELGDKTFKYILRKIKPGVSEKELAFEIELFIKKHGADISFLPIVAFGKNSSIPHHQTSDQRLKTNSIILLDFGVKMNNYCSDMTRTVFLEKATPEQKKMYQTVLEAQEKAIQQLNNCTIKQLSKGTKASKVDKVARDYITSHGYPTIPHSLGHGVGLEVHEAPRLSPKSEDLLKPGMVFSIEPCIYIPGFGSPRSTRLSSTQARVEAGGVRIEDLVVLERSGVRLLTKSPRGTIEL